jgi:hypothetical protein
MHMHQRCSELNKNAHVYVTCFNAEPSTEIQHIGYTCDNNMSRGIQRQHSDVLSSIEGVVSVECVFHAVTHLWQRLSRSLDCTASSWRSLLQTDKQYLRETPLTPLLFFPFLHVAHSVPEYILHYLFRLSSLNSTLI